MKYLLYYKLDSKFVSDQTAAGGDGTKVVSVVDGVAWTHDAEKAYYRLTGEASAITSYTVTVHYVFYDIALRKTINVCPDDVYNVDVYTGTSGNSLFVQPKNAEGYGLDDEAYKMVEVSGNTEVTFNYKQVLASDRLVFYYSTLNSQTSNTGYTFQLIGNESALDGLVKIIFDDETELLPGDLLSGTSVIVSSAKTVHKFEYVYDHMLTDIPDNAFSGCCVDKMIFPTSITGIGSYAFRCPIAQPTDGTPGLVSGGTWTIPGHIKRIGDYAFSFLSSSRSARDLILEDGIEYIGRGCFDNYGWNLVHISNTLKYIGGNRSFWNCTGPNDYVVFPDSLEKIDSYGYNNPGAFIGSRFTGATFGRNLSFIGDGAFTLSEIAEVTFTSPVAPTIRSSAFPNATSASTKTVYCPASGPGYDNLINYFTQIGWICRPTYFKAYFETTGANQTVKLLQYATAVTEAYVDDTILVSGSDIEALTAYTFETPGIHTITVTQLSSVSATPWMHYVASIYNGNTDLVRIDYLAAGSGAPQQVQLTNCGKLSSVTLSDGTLYIDSFSGNTSLTSIVMPDSITRFIQGGGFKSCTSLTSVTLSKNIENIGASAFCQCTSLTSIKLPNSVSGISSYAFYGCTSLKDIEIGNNLKQISNTNDSWGYAFGYCTSLEKIKIPDSCAYIGANTFRCCTSLKDIDLGNGVSGLGPNCFYSAVSLTSITLPNSIELISGNGQCFYACYNLAAFYGKFASADHRLLISGCSVIAFAGAGLTSYTIPDTVCSLANYSFFQTNVAELNIPSSITDIDVYAFKYTISSYSYESGWLANHCPKYNNIYYPTEYYAYGIKKGASAPTSFKEGTKYIGDYFYSGYNVTSVTLPQTVEKLGAGCFWCCSGLTSIVIPNSVTELGKQCFYSCKSLTSVTLSNTLTYIPSFTFEYCNALTGITIPTSVTGIGAACFESCYAMSSVTMPDSVQALDPYGEAFYGNHGIFYGCTGLTSVTLSNNLTGLSKSLFSNCKNLTSITIPNGVKRIEQSCFAKCTRLTGLTFPENVEYLGAWVIDSCSALTSLTSLATTAPELYDDGSPTGTKAFSSAPKNGILYYPSGSDYSVWMGQYQLGNKNWTTQEI